MEAIDAVRVGWEHRAGDFHDRAYGPMSSADAQATLHRQAGVSWARKATFAGFGNTIVYPPILYLPAMAGWGTGEALKLNILHSLWLARLLCALVSIALGWLALGIGAGMRWGLLAILLLPSVLFVNACCSQDAAMVSATALVAGIVFRAVHQRRALTAIELTVTGLLLGACAMARLPYATLGLILFVPEIEAGERNPRTWLAPAITFAAVLASCVLWHHLVAPLGLDVSDEADPGGQLAFLRGHPLAATIALTRGTWEAGLDLLHRGLYVVGWNDLLPHHGLEAVLIVSAAVLVFVAPATPAAKLSLRSRVLILLAVAASLVGISLAEYLIWTPVGGRTVFGIQPRYWMPVLPLALLAVQGLWRGRIQSALREVAVLAAATATIAVALTLPEMTAHAFYRAGAGNVLLTALGHR
jgi:uncharacterized membrane protein